MNIRDAHNLHEGVYGPSQGIIGAEAAERPEHAPEGTLRLYQLDGDALTCVDEDGRATTESFAEHMALMQELSAGGVRRAA